MTAEQTPEVDIETFAAARDAATVVDVREVVEYVDGHVPGALLMPLAQVPARMTEISKERQVMVICASGNRSRVATDVLRHAGYDAHSVAGGTKAWVRSGRPVEEGR